MVPTQRQDTQVLEQAMPQRHRDLCAALDRLLTIGAYYQPSHDRFKATARAAEEALRKAVAGFDTLEIQVQDQGLAIQDGFLAGNEPEARRLFELLDPLHVALLEIDAGASSDHLHLAFATLKKALAGLGKRVGYGEVTIKGLPDTVRTVSRSLFLKTRASEAQPPAAPPPPQPEEVTEAVKFFDHNMVSSLLQADPEKSRRLERDFVGIIQGILNSLDPSRLSEGAQDDEDPTTWLPPESVAAIKGVLGALATTDTDLMTLDHLIAQARSSLEITGDPELVDLVFARLQKSGRQLVTSGAGKSAGSGQALTAEPARRRPVIMSLQEMQATVAELEVEAGPMPDPRVQAAEDTLAICLQVQSQHPTPDLAAGIEQTLLRILSAPDFSPALARALVPGLTAILEWEDADLRRQVWPLLWGPLRRNHPRWQEPLWRLLWPGLSSRLRERAWPFLVNDLLLGMEIPDRLAHYPLLDSLSRVQAADPTAQRIALENLEALREQTVCPGFFDVPAPLLYPVHGMLVGCSFAPRFGPLLHQHLLQQAPHPLSSVLLAIMDGYVPTNRSIYQAILEQGVVEKLTPEMAEMAPPILQEALADLHWDFMEEAWVVPAITWLGELGGAAAAQVLAEIIDEKKYMVLSSWPRAARDAAVRARGRLRERLSYQGRSPEEKEAAWTSASAT